MFRELLNKNLVLNPTADLALGEKASSLAIWAQLFKT